MLNSNGQSGENTSPLHDPVIMSEALMASLRDLILSFDHREMAEALRLVHDITLYFSDITLGGKGEVSAFSAKGPVGRF